jgi:hypothetical protein
MLPQRAISQVCICHMIPSNQASLTVILTRYNSHSLTTTLTPFSLQLLPSSLCHSHFIALHYINLSITSSSSLLYTRGRRAPGSTGHSSTLTVRNREVDLKGDHSRSCVVQMYANMEQLPHQFDAGSDPPGPQSSDSPPAVTRFGLTYGSVHTRRRFPTRH